VSELQTEIGQVEIRYHHVLDRLAFVALAHFKDFGPRRSEHTSRRQAFCESVRSRPTFSQSDSPPLDVVGDLLARVVSSDNTGAIQVTDRYTAYRLPLLRTPGVSTSLSDAANSPGGC
jgi:hypothetical protein